MKKYFFAVIFLGLVAGCTSNQSRPTRDNEQEAALREFQMLRFERGR